MKKEVVLSALLSKRERSAYQRDFRYGTAMTAAFVAVRDYVTSLYKA